MGAFDFPAAGFSAAVLGLRKLVGLARHVRHVAAFANLAVDRPTGVAFVEGLFGGKFGSAETALEGVG